jgi:hypothetical protein
MCARHEYHQGIVNSQNTANGINKRAINNDIDWVFHVGDIRYLGSRVLFSVGVDPPLSRYTPCSYADDHVFEFQSTWNTWAAMMENTTALKPYMVLPGTWALDPLSLSLSWR